MVAGRDLDWQAVEAQPNRRLCRGAATDPRYILTSGTTGQPKGVVRSTGGHLVALKWSMPQVYGVQPGEVFWPDVAGWSAILISSTPTFHGCTSVLFEGKPVGTLDAGTLAGHRRPSGVGDVHRANGDLRDQERGPDGALLRATTSLSSALNSRGAATPIPWPGAKRI